MKKDTRTTAASDQNILHDLACYIDTTRKALGGCPTRVVVSRKTEILYESYIPANEPDHPFGPINERALWPLFSATKSYIAGLLLSLATDGILDLDAPVADHLPEFTTAGDGPCDRRNITVRHLASHTSGAALPEEARPSFDTPPDLNQVRIDTSPGQVFLYSGLGMHILERTIEAATGQDLFQALKTRILDPLGLDNTCYVYQYDPQRTILPFQTESDTDLAQNFSFAIKGLRAHFGLYSTARDFNRYGQLWLSDGVFEGHRYFTPELKQQAWTHHSTRPSDNGRYGLLWWLFEGEGGYVISGADAKATAVVPETDVVISVLRLPIKPTPGPYSFYEDKKQLVLFGQQLGN